MYINLHPHPELEAWVQAESERTGKSASAIVREAISEYAAARGVTILAELPRTLHPNPPIARHRRLGRTPKHLKQDPK